MTENRPCQHCGSLFKPRDQRSKFCSGACRQADYRRRHPRQAYRPKQEGKRPDTRYVILPAEVLDRAIAEVEAHDRQSAIRAAGGGSLIAVPTRNVGV